MAIIDINLVIGLGFIFGFSAFLTILTKTHFFKGLFAFALILSPFVYKAGYIDLWVIIALIFFNIVILTNEIISIRKG